MFHTWNFRSRERMVLGAKSPVTVVFLWVIHTLPRARAPEFPIFLEPPTYSLTSWHTATKFCMMIKLDEGKSLRGWSHSTSCGQKLAHNLSVVEHSDSGKNDLIRFYSRWRIDFSIWFDSIGQCDKTDACTLIVTHRLIITYNYFLIVCIIDFCEVLIHYSL